MVVGLTAEWETESHDRIMFGLPGRQDELVRRVAAANPRTVVVLNAGGPLDLPWLDDVPAAIMAWYPGQEFGAALTDVLFGVADPGGRLPVTFPRRLEDAPTAGSVPGDGQLLKYSEGLLIGHRWYAANQIDPLLSFGHGLSYADFRFGSATIDGSGDPTMVSVPVSNVAARAGKVVVQAYLRPEQAGRPRVLAGFVAAAIDGGADATLSFTIDPHVLREWDIEGDCWQPLVGNHRLEIGTSSTAIDQVIDLAVAG